MTAFGGITAFPYGIVVPFAIVLAFPFFWMAVTSLKPEAQVYDPTKVWSFHPTLASWGYLFHHTDYLRWLAQLVLRRPDGRADHARRRDARRLRTRPPFGARRPRARRRRSSSRTSFRRRSSSCRSRASSRSTCT